LLHLKTTVCLGGISGECLVNVGGHDDGISSVEIGGSERKLAPYELNLDHDFPEMLTAREMGKGVLCPFERED
jgi:hypothetical protein